MQEAFRIVVKFSLFRGMIGRALMMLSILCSYVAVAQVTPASHPISTQSEIGFAPCNDTFSIFKRKEFYDIGVILPSWLPVYDNNYVAVLEGRVVFNAEHGGEGAFVSHEDLPFYHYTHDLCFNVIPDPTPDKRFEHLLPLQVFKGPQGNDTILKRIMHVEWETGIGAGNRNNPFTAANDYGRSAGFITSGHERGDMIWNFPTAGDWVHVEGHYVWDRGHPPAKTEIHPPRMLAIERNLPERVIIGDSSVKYSTRIDVFASGDGSALVNNRYDAPKFVKRVNMSSKDYVFTVRALLPKPSANAVLKHSVQKRKADTFGFDELVSINSDSGTATVTIPWRSKNANDLEVYARSIYLYWDEGSGINTALPVDVYKVKLTSLRFDKLSDKMSRAELRVFANVGSEWIFLNDFHTRKGKQTTAGMGKTRKKKWTLNNEFIVYIPRGKSFRVFMEGWEADGVDKLMGDLLDPNSTCNKQTKRFVKLRLFSISKMLLKGCMDDHLGEISQLHNFETLGRMNQFSNAPKDGYNEDPCPFSKYPLKDRYHLTYIIEKLN